ncbi:MAG TPA: nucleoside hydrolase-like domain-containing protein [Gemmataceae bacterium]|nr:nucleoside hydrolase-like domain-containing protein [Gemmataceae bacterium]
MRTVLLTLFGLLALPSLHAQADDRLRVIIETDLGGDADDQASFVRFLLYAIEWDVEGVIADRPAATFDKDPVRDHLGLPARDGYELALAYLKAYGEIHPNLARHAKGYPSPEEFRKRTVPGHNDTDAGVRLLTAAADRDDPRPIWYGNWGSNSGATSNLRRALDRAKAERTPAEFVKFAGKFRIVTLDGPGPNTRQGHDEHIALHVETGYPTLDGARWYHRFRPLTEKAGGFDVGRDVKKGGGALGALYTTPKEGDSWSFVYLIPTGLSDPTVPTWGGWAGRYGQRDGDPLNKGGPSGKQFYWANQKDRWEGKTSRDNTALRWAAHLQNDFRARLRWCVAERFADANHPPVPHCQGDGSRDVLRVTTKAGKPYALDATGSSEPDGDRLSYRWFVYPEPGSYRGEATVRDAGAAKATLDVPADAAGKTIHVVLQVTDAGTPPLTRYRRVVVTGE